jgi:hypothetical protein
MSGQARPSKQTPPTMRRGHCPTSGRTLDCGAFTPFSRDFSRSDSIFAAAGVAFAALSRREGFGQPWLPLQEPEKLPGGVSSMRSPPVFSFPPSSATPDRATIPFAHDPVPPDLRGDLLIAVEHKRSVTASPALRRHGTWKACARRSAGSTRNRSTQSFVKGVPSVCHAGYNRISSRHDPPHPVEAAAWPSA